MSGPDFEMVRTDFWDELEREGETFCPCCDRFIKIYHRHINGAMAVFLAWLVRRYRLRPDWIHVPTEAPLIQGRRGGGDFAKLEYWGFIEERTNSDQRKRNSGWWRPTDDGAKFVHRRLRVPQYAIVVNNEVLKFTGDLIGIGDALGDRFDYRKLMTMALPSISDKSVARTPY